MSLSDWERHHARYKGGKDIAAQKSHLAKVLTSLRKVAVDRGLTDIESTTLRGAAQVLDSRVAQLEKDIREAKAIKADYDKRLKEAAAELSTLPHQGIDDIIALRGLRSANPLDRYDMDRLRTKWTGESVMEQMRGYANTTIGSLAQTCADEDRKPAEFKRQIIEAMPKMKEQHAALIREVNTLAVAEQLSRSAVTC